MGILLLSLNAFSAAKSGQDKGNGGGGHACGDSVELYDFYEGRNPLLHGIQVWETDPALSVEDYIEKAMSHLKKDVPRIGHYIEKRVKDILEIPYDKLVFPILIPRTLDADIPLIGEGCEFKQVASWNDRFDKIFFSRSVFEKMDNKSKAGLYVHEAMYKIARESGLGQNSDAVRKLVAQIFSDEEISKDDLVNMVLPEGEVLFIPKTGMCTLYIEVAAPAENLSRFEAHFGEIGKGLPEAQANLNKNARDPYDSNKRIPRIIAKSVQRPCESIYKNGLIGIAGYNFVEEGYLRVSFMINGQILRDPYARGVKNVKENGEIMVVVGQNKMFQID